MTSPPERASPSIVVVDDAPANLMLLANILEEAGYQVRVASSALRALALVRRQPPDLILLDVNLPDRNGYDVCLELKGDSVLKEVPVIFLSADDSPAAREKALEAGGAEYLVKPFEAADVLTRITSQLLQASSRREVVRLEAEVGLWRSRAESLHAALCGTLPGTVLDGRFRIEDRLQSPGEGARFRAFRVDTGEEVTLEIPLVAAPTRTDPSAPDENSGEREVSSTGLVYVTRKL